MVPAHRGFFRVIVVFLSLSMVLPRLSASDITITGTVTDVNGAMVPDARISMIAGTREFATMSRTDGSYSLRISGIYELISGEIEIGMPFPNPFSLAVNIPFIINSSGDVRFSVYNFAGQKIYDIFFKSVGAGSYHIAWDGCDPNGSPQRDGFYFYAITFKGKTKSGKLVKAAGFSAYSTGTALVSDMVPPVIEPEPGKLRLSVITSVTCQNYYPVRLTDITISRDTIIDFVLAMKQAVPFRTSGDYIAMNSGSEFRQMILKGINLGSSPPGYFPGEISYAVSADEYEKWIQDMADAGFNSIRVYTLHPPVFYEKLANYNQRHPDKPLFLFQGIWLDEIDDPQDQESYDLIDRIDPFTREIHDVIDCIHGNGDIAYRYGKSYGRYLSDLSRWTAGWILGREISPQEVDYTNSNNPSLNTYSGENFNISGSPAADVFVTKMLDLAVSYENKKYEAIRPVSLSSWPTLDPLTHPSEPDPNEDDASFDLANIVLKNPEPGIFASYHAYPYYPNFVSEEPSYRLFNDTEGPDSYLGYLTAMKDHYHNMPLVIAEFGVPSSWGSAHQSFSNMNHGGYSETQQGEKNVRIMHNILEAGCGGGFVFAWMDEWFKPTWVVSYLEAYGVGSGDNSIPTRQLWHNITSPEQNFGLLSFDQKETLPFVPYETNRPSGPLRNLSATNDNGYFYLNIETNKTLAPGDTLMVAFDTYLSNLGESQLPNGKVLDNRSEFLLTMVLSQDTADYYVTQAYDMDGLTPRFDLANHAIQKFRSTITDGAPWILMQWKNDGYFPESQQIGKLPAENSPAFTTGRRSAVSWNGNRISIRIPWTLLYFRDPTQMQVIDGAVSYDGGHSYDISTAKSDGIGVSVYFDGVVTSSQSRYSWPLWLTVPVTVTRLKESYGIMKSGLSGIPDFVN